MPWTDHTGEDVALDTATPQETLLLALSMRDPRDVEEMVGYLDRHGDKIDRVLAGRGRMEVLRSESLRGWLFGALGLIGPFGAIAAGIALLAAHIGQLSYPSFAAVAALSFLTLRLAAVRPDRRDWLAVGSKLGAGVVAAWSIRRHGPEAPKRNDRAMTRALVEGPEYWHDLAVQALTKLPIPRREAIVLEVFGKRPEDSWHLLPHVPTSDVVRAALAHGPKSTVSAEFHAFGALLRKSSVEPVLAAIQSGAGNRDVLIRAVATSGNPAAADLLISTLSERNERLRNVAREGLVALGPAVLPRLFNAFSIEDAWVQQGLARVMRDLGPDAQVERFALQRLSDASIDEEAAATLRRIVLCRRTLSENLTFGSADASRLDAILAMIPSGARSLPGLRWITGEALSERASATLTGLITSEGPSQRCAELAGIRHLLTPDSRAELRNYAREHSRNPLYRMVLADDQDLLRHHLDAAKTRSAAEEWVDVLERHASLAAVHALDELWRTGVDGVVQTAAMAALMRLCGDYDGVETFADQTLNEALNDHGHSLYEVFARGQFRRFEQMMVSAKRISLEALQNLYATIPGQQVLWGCYREDGELFSVFRIDEEYAFLDENDDWVDFPPNTTFGIVHPAELGATACRVWAEVFSDYELVPHFEQLQRRAWYLSHEDAGGTLFRDFPESAPSGRVEGHLIQRGWRPSPTDVERVYTLTKPVQRGRASYTAVIELSPGFGEDADEAQELDFLAFWNGHHHVFSAVVKTIPLANVDAVVFSEVVLELREILATAASNEANSVPAILARDA